MKKRPIKLMEENDRACILDFVPEFKSIRQEFRFRRLVFGDPVKETSGITDSLGLKIRKRRLN